MISCQRPYVQLPDDLHYLNLAYMAPLYEEIAVAGKRSVLRQENPLELGKNAMFDEVDELRALFAQLVGIANANRVALMPSASYGLTTAARNLPLQPGQNVIVAGDQFPSNYYPWARACSDHGAELRVIKAPEKLDRRGLSWNRRLLESIDGKTCAVTLPNAHWSDGTLFDLSAIRRRTREVGALLIIDGTQSVGAVPIDVAALELDALVCAGYKTLLGPYGTAFGYFGPAFDEGRPLEETWVGRVNSDDFANLVSYQDRYRADALRYDAGERCNFITMPMMKAALELLLHWSPEAISSYCGSLTSGLSDRLGARGFWIEDENQRAAHLFGVRPPASMEPKRVFDHLGERRVAVSLRGRTIRVSPHLYNTAGDIEALVEALLSSP